jgi:hypothetical protein
MATENPWLKIWVRPRETIRNYLSSEHPERGMIWLAVLSGYLNGLDNASSREMGDKVGSMSQIFLGYALGGVLGSLIFLYLGAWVLKVTGRWIGGEGTTPEIRTAIARGFFMPAIVVGLLWIPELLLFGSEMFTRDTPRIDASPTLTLFYYVILAIEFAALVWLTVVGLKSLGEAHRFSAWKALFNVLIPVLILLAVVLVIGVLVSVIR